MKTLTIKAASDRIAILQLCQKVIQNAARVGKIRLEVTKEAASEPFVIDGELVARK